MKLPPAIVDLHVSPPDGRAVRVWLPLFLLWPLLLVLAVLALVLTVLADVVLLLAGQTYHRYTLLLAGSLGTLAEMRGLTLSFNDRKNAVSLTVR